MPLSKLTTDLNIHQSLPDQPNANDGLTPEELKAKFDEAANLIKDYVNNTQTVELDARDNANVKLTGNQTIADVKTFTSSPIVPVPITDTQASTKKYVDDTVLALENQTVKTAGNQTIADIKTFTSSPIVPTPTTDMQASTKKYVDARELHLQGQVTANANNISNLQLADTQNVKLTGNQTVTGVKTFSDNPVVPTPTQNAHASTKQYVDQAILDIAVGDMPEGSITDNYLSDNTGQIKDVVSGLDSTLNAHLAEIVSDSPHGIGNIASEDYEEGIWTPYLTTSNNDVSGIEYTRQHGRYTKVGNVVNLELDMQISAKGTGSGALHIGGLPFSAPETRPNIGVCLGNIRGIDLTGYIAGSGTMGTNSNLISLRRITTSGSNSTINYDILTDTFYMQTHLFYIIG